jgi:hypothetical protein
MHVLAKLSDKPRLVSSLASAAAEINHLSERAARFNIPPCTESLHFFEPVSTLVIKSRQVSYV